MDGEFVFFVICAALVCAVICMEVARSKRRNPAGWFLLGLIFGPLAILAVAVTSPPPPPSTERNSVASEIERLSALHARGALSDSEFESAKARLLT